jgi:hypothetical protein
MLQWKSSDDMFKSKDLYNEAGLAVRILLSTAYLEVLHAALKFVPSNPAITFLQVFARFVSVFGVVHIFKVVINKTY